MVVFERVLKRKGVVRGVRRRGQMRIGGIMVVCRREDGEERRGAQEEVGRRQQRWARARSLLKRQGV